MLASKQDRVLLQRWYLVRAVRCLDLAARGLRICSNIVDMFSVVCLGVDHTISIIVQPDLLRPPWIRQIFNIDCLLTPAEARDCQSGEHVWTHGPTPRWERSRRSLLVTMASTQF